MDALGYHVFMDEECFSAWKIEGPNRTLRPVAVVLAVKSAGPSGLQSLGNEGSGFRV